MADNMTLYEHRDVLGTSIKLGDYIAIAQNNNMEIAIVTKLGPKMVICRTIGGHGWESRKYSKDTIICLSRKTTSL